MKLVLGRQNPTFSVAAVQLRADITYSKATVSVIIDERGLNKYARDYINEVDQLTVAFGKGLFDYPVAADTITSAALEKPFTDDYTADDVVRVSVGYIRAYAENITSSDQIQALIAAKILADLVSATETHVFTLSKYLSDAVVVIDNADANNGDGLEYTDLMPSSDAVGTTDTATAALEKQLADAVGLLDALQNGLSKVLTDTIGVSELAALALGRPLADIVNTVDTFSRTLDAVRTYADSVNQTETLEFDSSKPLAHLVTPTDSFNRVFTAFVTAADSQATADTYILSNSKPLTDTTVATEFFDRVFGANRTVSDSTLTTDLLASIDVSKLLTDAANAVSSGSLRMTDYADITYFAEDYVGSTRTFS